MCLKNTSRSGSVNLKANVFPKAVMQQGRQRFGPSRRTYVTLAPNPFTSTKGNLVEESA